MHFGFLARPIEFACATLKHLHGQSVTFHKTKHTRHKFQAQFPCRRPPFSKSHDCHWLITARGQRSSTLTLFLSIELRKSRSVWSEIPPWTIRTFPSMTVAMGRRLKTSWHSWRISRPWVCRQNRSVSPTKPNTYLTISSVCSKDASGLYCTRYFRMTSFVNPYLKTKDKSGNFRRLLLYLCCCCCCCLAHLRFMMWSSWFPRFRCMWSGYSRT